MTDNGFSTVSRTPTKVLMEKNLEELSMENKSMRNEIEHLKNTLIGLNEKLTVFNDFKKDLD